MNWKIISIILIIIQIIEIAYVTFAVYLVNKEETLTKECYYDFCNNYTEADYVNGICYCYEIDLIGNYKIAKTKILD
jgi:uncharacterized protein YpmS